ncbi:C1q-like domain-containing protein [Paenibacillus sp. YAF4_2]|uniref:C1q-like domain-containing protein n=1 Tax=Paenibacillus sp. YAF4_2 TaxID=3233085 RepID=UPI003F9D0A31
MTIKKTIKKISKSNVKSKSKNIVANTIKAKGVKRASTSLYRKKRSTYKKTRSFRKSAFRAVSNQFQTIISTTVPQVIYSQEVFDLGNEYNPATSTFTAKQKGIYNFSATVNYGTEPVTPVTVTLVILVNDEVQIPVIETLSSGSGIVLTTGVVKLSKGDTVQVVIRVTADGFIFSGTGTRFEGFRVR